jgi:hypothetical protein
MPIRFESNEPEPEGLSPKFRAIQFLTELKKYSDNKDDPISDWEFGHEVRELSKDDDVFLCICSTRIHKLYKIHKINDNSMFLEIGCECIKRWLHPSITCDECSCVLGSVVKRMKTKDYLCRKCKNISIKEKAREARETRIQELENIYYVNYDRHFREIIRNRLLTELILNKQPVTKAQKLFEEYVRFYFVIKE